MGKVVGQYHGMLIIIGPVMLQATSSAVFAILLGLSTEALKGEIDMTVRVGSQVVRPEHVEAGTGFFEARWLGENVTAAMGVVQVDRRQDGIAWGGLHWQRFGSTAAVDAAHDGPLKVTKELVGREAGSKAYAPLAEVSVRPGVEILVRLILHSDR